MDNLRVRTTSVLATLLPFLLRMTPDEAEIVFASCQVMLRQGQVGLQRLRCGDFAFWSEMRLPMRESRSRMGY
jgi:hypothetical protein